MEDNPFYRAMERLCPPKAPPSIGPAAIAEYLRSLETPAKTTPTPLTPLPTVSAPIVERSVLDKIGDATGRVRKAISDGKLNRSGQLEWTSRLLVYLRPFYGRQSPLLKILEQWRKEISKTPLS